MIYRKQIYINENGFVSIIVTMIIMIVITLIVIGFAQLARREQRAALDRQLGTQAFYAAESGANVIQNALNKGFSGLSDQNLSNCDALPPGLSSAINLDATAGVNITCAFWDKNPSELGYSDVSRTKPTIIPVDNSSISSFKISWEASTTGTPKFRSATSDIKLLPNTSDWNSKTGILRVQIVPKSSLNRTNLLNNSRTVFLYPKASITAGSVTTIDWGSIKESGNIISGVCNPGNTPKNCNVKISSLPNSDRGFYIILRAIYAPVSVSVKALNNINQEMGLNGAQVFLDITAKSNDVIKRMQIRRPLETAQPNLPIGFTSINSICKELVVSPSSVSDGILAACSSL